MAENTRELTLDEMNRIIAGTISYPGLLAEAGQAAEPAIPFICDCGTAFFIRIGEKEVKCPNPRCSRIHKISG